MIDTPRDDEWCIVAEAARRLRVTPAAIRHRIKRRTLEVRPNGNVGHLVRVPRPVPGTDVDTLPSTMPETVSVSDTLIAELRDRIAELQARLASVDAERASLRQEMSQERAATAQERMAAHEAATAQVAALNALLEEMRRDRDRWHTAATERRSWWPFRRHA